MPYEPEIPGAPRGELIRSRAALKVGELAAASGFFFAHFEHHRLLGPVPDWEPVKRPDLGRRQGWRQGQRAESKFRDFRLDRPVASFHPGHGPKWTAHELCHRLVGFAWKPGASQFYIATMARLAELLPVTLWYFLDEAGLKKCPLHRWRGPAGDELCLDCSTLQAEGFEPNSEDGWKRTQEGLAYLENELTAIRASLREGQLIPHRYGNLDLCSDGLAWAAAHGKRLGSKAFHRYAELFLVQDQGWVLELDALEFQVRHLAGVLAGEGEALPLQGGAQDGGGRGLRWVAQDLGWRFLELIELTDGEVERDLKRLCEQLGGIAQQPETQSWVQLEQVISDYQWLYQEWELPEPEEFFAVGYTLPKEYGRSSRQLFEGLKSVCPGTLGLLKTEAEKTVARFTQEDRSLRQDLGARFAGWLQNPLAAELAALEVAVMGPLKVNLAEATLAVTSISDEVPLKLVSEVVLLEVSHDWSAWLEGRLVRGLSLQPLEKPQGLAILRLPSGEAQVDSLSPDLFVRLQKLQKGEEIGLTKEQRDFLVRRKLLIPMRWF